MFCPACEAEFVEEITCCPDDLVDLVERLTPRRPGHDRPMPPAGENLVVVKRIPGEPRFGEPHAEFIRTALLENHIGVWITGEYAQPGPYGYILDPPVVEVLVRRQDAERAADIIAEMEG